MDIVEEFVELGKQVSCLQWSCAPCCDFFNDLYALGHSLLGQCRNIDEYAASHTPAIPTQAIADSQTEHQDP